MNLSEVVNLPPPEPWRDGDNIPWNEPDFSRRMLFEHLSQEHDAASRRVEIIDAQVDWIHSHLLAGRSGRVLDLACGPGLYCSRLARRGHQCLGIDYSPAAIDYANRTAHLEGLQCEYRLHDIRTARYETGFDIVMLLYGEFNVFRPTDARSILQRAASALTDGGKLLLEAHTFRAVQAKGARNRPWYASNDGLFSERPHLLLQEHVWDATRKAATSRFLVVDAEKADVQVFAQTFQAYSDDEYRAVLSDGGFAAVEILPSMIGAVTSRDGLVAIVARKAAS